MERISNIKETEEKVLADMNTLLSYVRDFSAENVADLESGLSKLRNIRSSIYENLNQIQHEYLILEGLKWLSENGHAPNNVYWYWNPRQTGDSGEPDLRGLHGKSVVISAEATTSEKPQGTIDARMQNTLAKLEKMPGRKYYFVRTKEMEGRAKTKVNRNGWHITVVVLEE